MPRTRWLVRMRGLRCTLTLMSAGVLLSGLVEALLVFCLGWFRESRKEKQELRGHFVLLSSEIGQNAAVLEAYRENPGLMRREQAGSLRSDAWEAARARVAQIAHPEVVGHLFSYYRFLGNARRLAGGWDPDDDPFVSPTVVFDQLEFAEKDANRAMDKHMPLPLSQPVNAFFAWVDRREAWKGR